MKISKITLPLVLLCLLCSTKIYSQQANCNNLFLDTDTFYISTSQPAVNGNLIYLDTNWTVYPVLRLLLADTSIITSPDMNYLSFLVYPIDSMEQFNFNINFKNSNFPNNTVVDGLFHIYDSDTPGDSIVTCYFPITLVLQNPSAISEVETMAIHIFPNPSMGEFTIDLGTKVNTVEVVVSNLMGQEISRACYKNRAEFNLNLEGEKGVYFVKLNYTNQTTVVKVVKD